MKRIVIALVMLANAAQAAVLNVQFTPRFDGQPLQFDAFAQTTAEGQRISVTRLDFLLSDFALRRENGIWEKQTNWFAYISAREGRTNFQVAGISPGRYDQMRFLVGLKPEMNHKSVATFPAGHPLNPEVNGLYWGWMGGYVFMALEGNWQKQGGGQSGFSYHIANDRELMTVSLPISLEATADMNLRLVLNVEKIFGEMAINDATATTHSRTNDTLADEFHSNIEHAFILEHTQAGAPKHASPGAVSHIEMAAGATPYRFTMSAYFPRPALPMDNPLTDQGVALGKKLFFDTALSVNNSQSCASCHKPASAFTDRRPVSIGAEGENGSRHAMPLFNLAWKSSFFWDGRATLLREQVLQPIQNPIEMHESLDRVVAKLKASKDYPRMFEWAFGTKEITADRMARALEQFLLTQVSCDSKFDRVINGEAKLTEEEQRGFNLFHTEYDPRREQYGADCFHCHGGPLFQSQNFGNNGLDAKFTDPGRYAVTHRKGDQGKFAVPSLRNVELTGPYMHDGRFKTLEEVVEHYCTGVQRSATLDPNIAKHPDAGLPLSDADKKALVAFLKTLTSESLRQICETKTAAVLPKN